MTQQPSPPLPPPVALPSAPIYLPSPFTPRGGGFGRALLTTLAVSIFGLSITLNIYLLLFSGIFSGGPITKTTVRGGDEKTRIAVLPVQGAITDATAAEINQLIGEAENDASVKAIVLEVNSPGGAVTASDEIYSRIMRLRSEKKLPVVVSMGALATSGGYYISCAADGVVAQRTTWTGNIGVLLPRYNFHKLAEQYGVEDQTVKSTGATFKDAGSPLKADTPEQQAYFQKLADDAFVVFKKVVSDGRSLDPATVDRIADGKVVSGPDALKLKLVDQIGYLDDAIDLAANKAGLSPKSVQAVRYEKRVGLFESLGRSSAQSQLRPNGNGVSLSIDRSLLEDVLSPRPLYMWRGQ